MEHTTVPAGTIVVGVDGSPGSARALQWAAQQSRLDHRALTLAHGNGSEFSSWMPSTGTDYVQVLDAMRLAGREVLDDATADVARLDPEIVVRTEQDSVDPRTLVVALSDSAAMVVLGSRGRGSFASTFLGSVSAAVAHEAHCPVVVVRPGPDDAGTAAGPHDGVLVAVDVNERSRAAVEFAFLQASQHGMPLTAVHCFADVPSAVVGGRPVGRDEPGFEELWMMLSEALAGMSEKYPDVSVTQLIRGGRTSDCLSGLATTMDLVVLGAHQRPSLTKLFASRTDIRVLEHATCAVAVVPSLRIGGLATK